MQAPTQCCNYEAEIEPQQVSCQKDSDGDGYGDLSPNFTVSAGSDCDDADAAQYPVQTNIAMAKTTTVTHSSMKVVL